MNSLIWFLIIGAIAGWLAGLLMKGRRLRPPRRHHHRHRGCRPRRMASRRPRHLAGGGLVGSLIVAFIGAVILLFLVRLIKRA